MKKLFLMLIAFVAVIAAEAAPALPTPTKVKQADGTWLTIQQFGDEYFHWTSTTDGLLVLPSDRGFVVADIDDNGLLHPTATLAHEIAERNSQELKVVNRQRTRHHLFKPERIQSSRRAQIYDKSNYLQHEGTPKVLVILAEFQDVKFTLNDGNPKPVIEHYFTGTEMKSFGHSEEDMRYSVQEYFSKCSGGNFVPQFDIVGPVTLSHDMAYYGEDVSSTSYDKNFGSFCTESISLVDDEVDFKQYDNDGDGKVELICIIYAGYGQNTNSSLPNTIWAKCTSQSFSTQDGVTVSHSNCSAELFRYNEDFSQVKANGTGVFLHEFSHGMGLPDIYPTTSSAYVNNQSMEYWDVMDLGCYGYNGFGPAAYTAWEQETFGWLEVEQLTASQEAIQMLPVLMGGKAYKFGNGANDEEWIYLENMQLIDKSLRIPGSYPAHGLLVYHVAYPKSTMFMYDSPNDTPGKPAVAVVPAGGELICGYLVDGNTYTQNAYAKSLYSSAFPGMLENKVTSLTDDMNLPNYKFYNGEAATGVSLKNITEDTATGVVTFDFVKTVPTAIKTISTVAEKAGGACYDLQGRWVASPTKGLYIQDGRKIVVK